MIPGWLRVPNPNPMLPRIASEIGWSTTWWRQGRRSSSAQAMTGSRLKTSFLFKLPREPYQPSKLLKFLCPTSSYLYPPLYLPMSMEFAIEVANIGFHFQFIAAALNAGDFEEKRRAKWHSRSVWIRPLFLSWKRLLIKIESLFYVQLTTTTKVVTQGSNINSSNNSRTI